MFIDPQQTLMSELRQERNVLINRVTNQVAATTERKAKYGRL
jgi:hypothetical protein